MAISTSVGFGAVLYQRRVDLGLTQAEVASRAGVSRQWLIAAERGKETAELGRMLRVMRVLHLALEVVSAEDDAAYLASILDG